MHKTFIIYIVALLTILMGATELHAENRGVPFIRNFSATDYKAHNRNFDVACDDYGTVYFANFEALLYWDGATWRKLYSPGISRITRVVFDKKRQRIWVGGFNVFGYLKADKQGRLQMHLLASDTDKRRIGEVDMIRLRKKDVFFHTTDNTFYKLDENEKIKVFRGDGSFINLDMTSVSLEYTGGINLKMLKEGGLEVSDATHKRFISEADGLCTSSINFVMYDRSHKVWGATNHGVFEIEIPSPYSHLTEGQGLRGEVYTINQIGSTIYAGTLQGTYTIINGKVTQLPGMDVACWELKPNGKNELIASTTKGLYSITQNGVRQITPYNTMACCPAPQGGFYTSELDAIYYIKGNVRKRIAPVQKGAHMQIIGNMLKVETINGEVWNIDIKGKTNPRLTRSAEDITEPKIDYTDALGRRWITDPEGKDLAVINNGSRISQWARPIAHRALNAVFCGKENSLWVGGDFGIINCDLSMTADKAIEKEPTYIRQIIINSDSVIWGGYSEKGLKPLSAIKDIDLSSDCRNITIDFSTRYNSLVMPTRYRYRINGNRWSAWSTETRVHFNNVARGTSTFEVEAIDLFGNISKPATVQWHINYPFYMRWWANIIYIIIIGLLIRAVIIYRMKKLERDNAQLESIVNKRTAELSNALDDLQRTQADLVRMERTATAGKLTQGLIDRILNPINYINNFSKLTCGLAKDLREDIEEEKENMSEDNYEDCEDIIDMMTTNLTKIEEHGTNATRTLRAMEAMLNTQVGTLRQYDVAGMLRQLAEVEREYYKRSIEECHIAFTTKIPDGEIFHEIDPESINNVMKAIISNAFYAVVKKYQREPYDAQVELRLARLGENHIEIIVHDNGVGIEEAIQQKVFDPFFTTKTTGEAAGVGLYLAREIIQDHKGTITVESLKDNYTNFIISL